MTPIHSKLRFGQLSSTTAVRSARERCPGPCIAIHLAASTLAPSYQSQAGAQPTSRAPQRLSAIGYCAAI
ncbi:hypothetical protein M405DRAFT_813223 [Rhizopogon salebrosus TDB-379]|nr:hypothetical protein M405DRAFT_813223 [Rhizopogon salebrosus TDB-379]